MFMFPWQGLFLKLLRTNSEQLKEKNLSRVSRHYLQQSLSMGSIYKA